MNNSPKKGDVIYAGRGLYRHYGIYDNTGSVIHFSSDKGVEISTGKSTLINNIIGTDILPVGITPETSLATELHYSPEEFIDAVKKDGSSDHYKVEEITVLKDRAAEYEYAKLFLKNDIIKEIEPLILIDMPGFDSPLDQHNKAINGYLGRGCHYIVLSSVEEGTVSKSLLRRLKFH